MTTPNVVGFWHAEGLHGFMGQWFASTFVENRIAYPNTECYMMYHKALLFHDSETAVKILKANTPKQMKSLGRQVKNFNQAKWDQHKYQIVVQGNMLKFSQNSELKEKLLATGESILAELSSLDFVWGVGTVDPRPEMWRGENLLGRALMDVRKALRT